MLRLNESQYDVGFQKQEDGSYVPVYDEWAGQIANQLANPKAAKATSDDEQHARSIGLLLQEYGAAAAKNAALSQGLILEEETQDEHGNYQLVFTEI